jgi:hypothetical protein
MLNCCTRPNDHKDRRATLRWNGDSAGNGRSVEASATEELSAREPHAGVCAGLSGDWQSWRDVPLDVKHSSGE